VIVREVRIRNEKGLHARPAALIANHASRFESEIHLTVDSREANAKSVLAVMSLAAVVGSLLRIRADGNDQEEAVATLAQLVEEGFKDAY